VPWFVGEPQGFLLLHWNPLTLSSLLHPWGSGRLVDISVRYGATLVHEISVYGKPVVYIYRALWAMNSKPVVYRR